MKLKGHTFEAPHREYCVLPRTNGDPVVFAAEPVLDYSEFERLCPPPTPPMFIKAGGVKEYDLEDETYQQQEEIRGQRRIAWIVLQSLKATEGLVWETVDFGNPATWLNFRKELRDAFFSQVEIQRIENAAYAANSLSEARVQEARENFLRGLAAQQEESSGLHTEQDSSQSGKPASV